MKTSDIFEGCQINKLKTNVRNIALIETGILRICLARQCHILRMVPGKSPNPTA